MHFVAIHPETGIRYQRESKSRAYRWCVVTPERQVVGRSGTVWTHRAEVAWSTLSAPRLPDGAIAIAARQVVDAVELADLAVERAMRHVTYCEREAVRSAAFDERVRVSCQETGEAFPEKFEEMAALHKARRAADILRARASLVGAIQKLERERAKVQVIPMDQLGDARDALLRELDAEDEALAFAAKIAKGVAP
jgi:hypothetical protein